MNAPPPAQRPDTLPDAPTGLTGGERPTGHTLPRPALARLVQKAIDRMDDMDTDSDREDDDPDHCLAGDDGCGAIVIDGRTYWGSDTEAIASL